MQKKSKAGIGEFNQAADYRRQLIAELIRFLCGQSAR